MKLREFSLDRLDSVRHRNEWKHRFFIPFLHAILWTATLFVAVFPNVLSNEQEGLDPLISVLGILCAFMLECALVSWDLRITHIERVVEVRVIVFQPGIFVILFIIWVSVVMSLLGYRNIATIIMLVSAGIFKYVMCRMPILMEKATVPFQRKTYDITPLE